VVLAGTVDAFSRAFEVKLGQYEHPETGSYRGRTGSLTVPSEVSTVIEGIFGLDNRHQAKPHFRIREKQPINCNHMHSNKAMIRRKSLGLTIFRLV